MRTTRLTMHDARPSLPDKLEIAMYTCMYVWTYRSCREVSCPENLQSPFPPLWFKISLFHFALCFMLSPQATSTTTKWQARMGIKLPSAHPRYVGKATVHMAGQVKQVCLNTTPRYERPQVTGHKSSRPSVFHGIFGNCIINDTGTPFMPVEL